MLTKVIEVQIWKNDQWDHNQEDIWACTPCLDSHSFTVLAEPETNDQPDSECQFEGHIE